MLPDLSIQTAFFRRFKRVVAWPVMFVLASAVANGQIANHGQKPSIFQGPPALVLPQGAGEGPAWHPRVGLLFSGHGGINRLGENKTTETYRTNSSTNGLLFDSQGRLLKCENQNGRITREDQSGQTEVLSGGFEGKPFNQPNDVTVDSKGRIYFSDPKYGPRTGLRQFDKNGKPVEGVYRIDPDGSTHRIIAHEVDRPNGVLVSFDQKYLLVADNNNDQGGARVLLRFDLRPDGTLDFESEKRLHDWGTGRGPDGMAQDRLGRLYVAGGRNQARLPHETSDAGTKGGIYVFTVDGELLDFVPIPNDEVTNCQFGDTDLKTLYITAGGTLWKIRTTSPGVVPWTRGTER